MPMGGWAGKLLRINLSNGKIVKQDLPADLAKDFLGGRGFGIKILWDELKPGTPPLSPENKLIFAVGPLTGTPTPSSGKLVIAAKSPLTGGYGDGNVGTHASYYLKKAGYDAIIIEGKSEKPVYIHVDNDKVEILDAKDLWGLGTFETIKKLREIYGEKAGYLAIGQGGENLVKFAVVVSELSRSAGRPGMGAVMGSKNVKALVIHGDKEVSLYDPKKVRELGAKAAKDIRNKPGYKAWIDQGTMAAVEWSQENSVLPVHNFSEGIFDEVKKINGDLMHEKYKYKYAGCPLCVMPCGNPSRAIIGEYKDLEVELDYENVALLGSNLEIAPLDPIIKLNYMLDDYGIDTISMGNTLGYVMELYEKGIINDKITGGIKLEFGNPKLAAELIKLTAYRKDFGDLLAEGTKVIGEKIGGDAPKYALQAKGLEVSGYDCHAAPGMALAYATSPIGAHHKDAWYIAQEVKHGRLEYEKWKAQGVIDLQRIRGGIFESIVACRLPWVELGLDLEYYPKFFNAVTGLNYTLNDLYIIADRIYTLIRAFWIREFGHWKREYDRAPTKWFITKLTKGPLAGTSLDPDKYEQLLSYYYEIRGWDERGIPRKSTLKRLKLSYVIDSLAGIGLQLNE
ncbi:MAG: aldehyde ferredoxin oxidoreductase family protein [Candidatus Njordarchaeum guaymaensis]